MNAVALIFCVAKTLIFDTGRGIYIIPILDFSPGSLTRRSSVFGNQLLMWLNTNVAYHCILMTFWRNSRYSLVIVWNIDLGNWWRGEFLKPVFIEKRAYVNTPTLLYLGYGHLVAALLIAGRLVSFICV